MAGVITERDRAAVRRAQTALRTQNQELFAPELARVPAHTGVLRQAEDVTARPIEQHLFGQGQASGRPAGPGLNLINVRRSRAPNLAVGHGLIQPPVVDGTKQELVAPVDQAHLTSCTGKGALISTRLQPGGERTDSEQRF